MLYHAGLGDKYGVFIVKDSPVAMPLPLRTSPDAIAYPEPPYTAAKATRCKNGAMWV